MNEVFEEKVNDWIEGIVKQHMPGSEKCFWSELSDNPTLHIERKNLRIVFPLALYDACSRSNIAKARTKARLATILHDVDVREYKNKTFTLTEGDGWFTT